MNTEGGNDMICGSASNKELITLGDYVQEHKRLNHQIVALQNQITILKESADQYDTSFFDSSLHQLECELYLRKKEIVPIILIISRSISQLVPDDAREMMYEHWFLGHRVQEIARKHETADGCVTRYINQSLRVSIPSEVVEQCGKILS